MRRRLMHAALAVLLAAPAAYAHHPFDAEFDSTKPVKLTGTVKEFEWRNPHSGIHLDGRDGAGKTGEWLVELANVADLTQAGWTAMSIKPGDKVTVEGWMAKDGSMHVNAKQVTTPAGKTMSAASSVNSTNPPSAAPKR
jgi:hypothetical protein